MSNYLYSRICKDWRSEKENHIINKLGQTTHIESRKWQGQTERHHPCFYVWYIQLLNLGDFERLIDVEQTVFNFPFFSSRRENNGVGSGDEFFEFSESDDPLRAVTDILLEYNVDFKIFIGDPYTSPPKKIVKEKIRDVGIALPIRQHYSQTSEIVLRSYQEEVVGKMNTVDIGTVVMATGVGKTITFLSYIAHAGGRYLIVVPTLFLVGQITQECRKILPSSFELGIKALQNNCTNVVVIKTYQSSHKLETLPVDCIIFDECHNSVVLNKPESESEYSRFQLLLKHPCPKKFFFTATQKNIFSDSRPTISMDNEDVYGPILYRYDVATAIEDGYLCDYNFHIIVTDDKLKTIKTVLKKYKKPLVFCSTLKKVEDVYNYLKKEETGVDIYKLGVGDDFKCVTRDFSNCPGKAVMIACKKLSVGYDYPQIDGVVHYNISSSSIVTTQRNGRGLRIHNDKVRCDLVFLCDNSTNEDKNKEEIRKLHSAISHMTQTDRRLIKRIEDDRLKSEGIVTGVDIQVDGGCTPQDSTRIYNRFWKAIGGSISYINAKKIIRNLPSKPQCRKDYSKAAESSLLPENPEDTFGNGFVGWVDYLGVNVGDYYTKEEVVTSVKNHDIDFLSDTKTCNKLHRIDTRFPPPDMWTDIYNLSKLSEIFKGIRDSNIDDFDELYG